MSGDSAKSGSLFQNFPNGSIASVIAGFSASAESIALFGNATSAQKVTAIYQNVFGRTPEAAGLAYWVAQLDSGKVSQAQASWAIQQAAGPGDTSAVSNKLIAAKAFTAQLDTNAEITGYNGAAAAALARAYLSKADATSASIANVTVDSVAAVATATGTAVVAPVIPVTPAAPAAPSSTFTATTTSQIVSFGGSATGDISVAWTFAGGIASANFTRDGVTAASTFGFAPSAKGITLASTEVLATSVANLLQFDNYFTDNQAIAGTGSVKVTNGSVNAVEIKVLDTNITPVLNVLAATVMTGNFSDTNIVKLANGASLNLSSNLNIRVTDTATVLSTKVLSAAGAADELTVTGIAAGADLSLLAGFEKIHLAGSTAIVTIADGAGTVVDSSAASIVTLGNFGQTFNGSAGNDIVVGGLGNDVISAGGGTNTLTGGGGNNTFNIADASTNNTISDLHTNDILVVSGGSVTANGVSNFIANSATVNSGYLVINAGSSDANIDVSAAAGGIGFIIVGGSGNDTITGSLRSDVLTGGAGVDTFVFTTPGNSKYLTLDRLVDFTSGTDLIKTGVVGGVTSLNQGVSYTAVGSAVTTSLGMDISAAVMAGNTAGSHNAAVNDAYIVTLTGTGYGTYIFQDTDGNRLVGANELVVQLVGLSNTILARADFIE